MTEEAVRVTAPTRTDGVEDTTGGPLSRGRGAGDGPSSGRRSGGLPVPTELIAFGAVALAVLIAAAVADGFDAAEAWTLVTILAAAYILSRGLAKHEHRGGHDRLD